MIYDLQKASALKRFSAFLLDIIVLAIIATLFCYIISVITGYDGYVNKYKGYQKQYEQEYGVSFNITEKDFIEMEDAQKTKLKEAHTAFKKDKAVVECYGKIVDLTIAIFSFGIFLAFIASEFVIPLLLKNGQTIGKKLFSIAVMQTNSVRISSISLFTRTVFGKYAIETMVPLYVVIMLWFSKADLFTVLLLFALIIAQIVIYFVTKTNSLLHDLLSDTVVVDMSSQMIFESKEALMEYKNARHLEEVNNSSY